MAKACAEAESRSAAKKARRKQQKAKPLASAALRAGPSESAECGERNLQKNGWPGAWL